MLDVTSLKIMKPGTMVAMQDTLNSSIVDIRKLLAFLEENKIDSRLTAAENEMFEIKKQIASLDAPMEVDPDVELEDADADADDEAEAEDEEPEEEKPDSMDNEFDLMILCVSGVSVLLGVMLGLAVGNPFT
jgi:hypothetical protein